MADKTEYIMTKTRRGVDVVKMNAPNGRVRDVHATDVKALLKKGWEVHPDAMPEGAEEAKTDGEVADKAEPADKPTTEKTAAKPAAKAGK